MERISFAGFLGLGEAAASISQAKALSKEREEVSQTYRCLWRKHSSGEEDRWDEKLSEHRIRG